MYATYVQVHVFGEITGIQLLLVFLISTMIWLPEKYRFGEYCTCNGPECLL